MPIKIDANNMELSHETWSVKHETLITGILWRISIILLPWQTRYFVEGMSLNGFPWEQGRFSFYASWIPMVMTIFFVCLQRVLPLRQSCKKSLHQSPFLTGLPVRHPLCAGLLIVVIASLFTVSFRATLQWWVQVLILFAFFWSLTKLVIDRRLVMKWFLISLIPHALFAFWQYATQFVIGSKWLGMAIQDPMTKGVSVIEIAGERILRVYGGFPHPNIFGGWLAVAISLGFWFALSHHKKIGFYLWTAISGVLTVALFLTYARSAWIACVVGLIILAISLFREKAFGWHKRGSIILGVLLVLVAGFFLFQQKMIRTRFDSSQRLETRSLDERAQGLKNGFELFKQHPLVGVGPGAANLAISINHPSTVPPVPPHNVFLLILDELGLIGFVGIILFVYGLFRRHINVLVTGYWLPVTLIVLAALDHYPWSLWSGLCLTGYVFYLSYSSAILPSYALRSNSLRRSSGSELVEDRAIVSLSNYAIQSDDQSPGK